MREWIKENKNILLVMVVYSICSFAILIFHEQWRDEAQVWLITRDLNFLEIIQQMKYEGHFLLWFIIIMPFSKLGLPYETMKIISWIIVNISAWLILKKSPFKIWEKILFLCSYPMLYLYPAIARCYCLIPLAITLIAITYEKRKEEPIKYIISIVLLANTHVLMLGLVGMLLLTFYIEQIREIKLNTKQENKKIALSFIIVCILLIISMLPLMGSLSTNKDISYTNQLFNIENILEVIKNQLIRNIELIVGENTNFLINIMIMVSIILYAIYEGKNYIKNFIIIAISILYQFIICGYVLGSTSLQKASAIIMIIFLFTWIQKKEKEKNFSTIFLTFLLIVNIANGASGILQEVKENYSSAKQTAMYINQNIEEESIIVTNALPYCSAIIPYTNKVKFWNIIKEEYFTFVNWDGETFVNVGNVDIIKEILDKNFDKNKRVYLIYGKFDESEANQLDLDENLIKVFESNISIERGESYSIYEIVRE